MFLLRTFQLGVKSLLLHPMRWLLAIGEGISEEAQRQIEGLGAENIIIRSIKPPGEAFTGSDAPIPYGLKREEFDMLVQTIPTIESALPIREVRRTFTFDGRNEDGRLVGCTPDYFDVTKLDLDRGRWIP